MSESIDSQICDLRLELNEQKQAYAALEVELMQREETVIKLQTEQQKHEPTQQALKAIKGGLDDAKKQENDTAIDSKFLEVEMELDRLKAKNKEDTEKIYVLLEKQSRFEKIVSQYEKGLAQKVNDLEVITTENDTTKRHLVNLELAFSDVHHKYERSKQTLESLRTNEDMLQHSLINSAEVAKKNEEKYDSLKTYAKAQIERANKELFSYREKHRTEVIKLSTIIKRLEIKNASLVQALDQKTTECGELAALCNEVTGRID